MTSNTIATKSNTNRRYCTRASKLGFTLLETLVVVALIALASAILLPLLLRVDTNATVSATQSLTSTLEELSERSLFMGRITALEITPDKYTPLYFDPDSDSFIAFDETVLVPRSLPEKMTLEWQPAGDDQLAKQMGQILDGTSDQKTGDSQSTSRKKHLPQIYFMPGGQATAGHLVLDDSKGDITRLRLSALGKVSKISNNNSHQGDMSPDASLPPLLLPNDASFYQRAGGH